MIVQIVRYSASLDERPHPNASELRHSEGGSFWGVEVHSLPDLLSLASYANGESLIIHSFAGETIEAEIDDSRMEPPDFS